VPTRIQVPGRQVSSEDGATYITVSDGYLRTMHITLLRGRWFSPQEMRAPGDGIVISEAVAKRYWGGADPVGKPLTIFRSSQERADFGRAVPSVVIGVVSDVRQFGPDTDPAPAVYVPLAAEPWPWASLVVRKRTPGAVSATALGRLVREVEPNLIGSGPQEAGAGFDSVEHRLSLVLAPRRYIVGLVGAFSACALLLAAIGIYGVTSYAVGRRTHEMGIRLALGATTREILTSVLVPGVKLALAGCAVGMVSALLLVRLLEHLLYDTSVTDPAVLVSVPVLLIAVGLIASYLPARRAARVDPMIALRSD
ncbi:MAG TPA: FtsX-like permease family protein, partial [Gemmatimonadaceae bacterium]